MTFDLGDYIDVPERIRDFKAEFPLGSLQGEGEFVRNEMGAIVGYIYKAFAYRNDADPRPGIGHAYEPIPGKTPYTKDSEVMNAETSAWGRAIVALGFETKKIASRQEVQNRRGESEPEPAQTDGDLVMTFGKYKDKKVSELPKPYKTWLVENFTPQDEYGLQILEAVKEDLIPF